MEKDKFEKLMENSIDKLEYNPKQSFILHVNWIVRSPEAAKKMIEDGFTPCSEATLRDSPATLAYFFRISKDQSLAERYKKTIKTISEHPHYQNAFKSLRMGIPLIAIKSKLKGENISEIPLTWQPNEFISDHLQELDFDPVVLECTEIYLDSRSFFEHASSKEWLNSSLEILNPSRSLKSTTFCLGNPEKIIWETTLEPYLKAIRFDEIETQIVKDLEPGIYFSKLNIDRNTNFSLFFEIDIFVKPENIKQFRASIPSIQNELEPSYMIVLPFNAHEDENPRISHIRLMFCVNFTEGLSCLSMKKLLESSEIYQGRVFVFNIITQEKEKVIEIRKFLDSVGLIQLEIVNTSEQSNNGIFAGFVLHPLSKNLTANENLEYNLKI